MTRVLLTLALLLAAPGGASATSVSVRAELHVPLLQNLETTPGIVTVPPIGVPDLERGTLEIAEPVTLNVSSNVPWELFVRRADPTGPALQASFERGPFLDVGTTWVSLASGPAGTDGELRLLRLRLVLEWTAADPGNHGLRLDYRLAPRGS